MRRVLLTIAGTVVGLVALLTFKTQGHPLSAGPGGLPSAAVSPSPAAASSRSSGGGATSAPPDPSRTPSRSPSSPSTRKFVGSAVETRYGVVQVAVTTTGQKISNVAFVQLTAFDDRSQEINSAAGPILLQETLTAQSANIDSVSGASYTSEGYVQSLQSALDRAGVR